MHQVGRKVLAAKILKLSPAPALGFDSYTKIHFLSTIPGQLAHSL